MGKQLAPAFFVVVGFSCSFKRKDEHQESGDQRELQLPLTRRLRPSDDISRERERFETRESDASHREEEDAFSV